MRFKDLQTGLRALGLTCRKTPYGEIRVAFLADGRDSERCAHYASDTDDAWDTGRAMHRERAANQSAWAAITYREGGTL